MEKSAYNKYKMKLFSELNISFDVKIKGDTILKGKSDELIIR
jgi:hypothetical protein